MSPGGSCFRVPLSAIFSSGSRHLPSADTGKRRLGTSSVRLLLSLHSSARGAEELPRGSPPGLPERRRGNPTGRQTRRGGPHRLREATARDGKSGASHHIDPRRISRRRSAVPDSRPSPTGHGRQRRRNPPGHAGASDGRGVAASFVRPESGIGALVVFLTNRTLTDGGEHRGSVPTDASSSEETPEVSLTIQPSASSRPPTGAPAARPLCEVA